MTNRGPLSRRGPMPCRNLRTKTLFYGQDAADPEGPIDSDTAVYWCTRTMGPIGPDGRDALPRACGRDRSCCEPTLRAEMNLT